jgi:hypothetical protein
VTPTEYKVVQATATARPDELEALLNGLAAEGWHLVTGYVNGGWPTFFLARYPQAITESAGEALANLNLSSLGFTEADYEAAVKGEEPVTEAPRTKRTTRKGKA